MALAVDGSLVELEACVLENSEKLGILMLYKSKRNGQIGNFRLGGFRSFPRNHPG